MAKGLRNFQRRQPNISCCTCIHEGLLIVDEQQGEISSSFHPLKSLNWTCAACLEKASNEAIELTTDESMDKKLQDFKDEVLARIAAKQIDTTNLIKSVEAAATQTSEALNSLAQQGLKRESDRHGEQQNAISSLKRRLEMDYIRIIRGLRLEILTKLLHLAIALRTRQDGVFIRDAANELLQVKTGIDKRYQKWDESTAQRFMKECLSDALPDDQAELRILLGLSPAPLKDGMKDPVTLSMYS
jgi:hypothetical protein